MLSSSNLKINQQENYFAYSILFLPCSRKFFHCSNTFHKKLLGVLKETVQGKAIKQDLINLIFFDVQ